MLNKTDNVERFLKFRFAGYILFALWTLVSLTYPPPPQYIFANRNALSAVTHLDEPAKHPTDNHR